MASSTKAGAHPHVERGLGYARAVVAGDIPACKWVRLACQRQLTDLARTGWGYRWDADAAERICRFVEMLPHTKGEWAKRAPGAPYGQTIRLEPWQSFILTTIFGWLRPNGTRRYRLAYIEVPRKNGKSIIAAGIGLYMLIADGEEGAEVYCGATTERQAWEVFKPAKLICEKRTDLAHRVGIQANARNINVLTTGSKFEPIIGQPGDGASPSCAITDEYHEHATSAQFDTMITGMGARRQPLSLIITTAGDNIAGPCFDLRKSICDALEETIPDNEKFGIVYTIDEGDDWSDPATLRKANPNYGVSIQEDFLLARQQEAVNNTKDRGRFLTKHLNCWLNARNAYFDMTAWGAGVDERGMEDFTGRMAVLGLDLASKVDISALQILILPETEGEPYTAIGRHYLPAARLQDPAADNYRAWHDDEWLTVTEGNITDYQRILDDVLEIATQVDVIGIGYDPHQATMLVTKLQDAGLPATEVCQQVLVLSEPMKTLDALIRARQLNHPDDPVMAWMMSNVVAYTDAKENVYPRKDRPEQKIDGPVALIMALALAMRAPEAGRVDSIYESGEDLWDDFGV